MARGTGDPALDALLARAIAAFESLTPEQQTAHLEAQKASWVKGQLAIPERTRKTV